MNRAELSQSDQAAPLITRREWWHATLVALIVAIVIGIPYAVGALSSTSDQVFTGFLVGRIGIEDDSSYLGKMQQGAHGLALGFMPHTGQPHMGTLFFLYYRVLGAGGSLLGVPLVYTFHLARLLSAFAFILILYRFIAEFVTSPTVRLSAPALVALSGGTGWLTILSGLGTQTANPPAEIVSPESYTFWMLYTTPHLILAMILLLLGALLVWKAYVRRAIIRAIAAGGLWLGMALLQPVFTAVVAALAAIMFLGRSIATRSIAWRQAGAGFLAVAIAMPMVIYAAIVISIDPVYSYWANTQLTTSGDVGSFLLSYAILLALALGGVREVLRRRNDPNAMFILVWFLLQPLLMYAPTKAQRRLIIGWQIPLNVLAAYGITTYVLPFIEHLPKVQRLPPNTIRKIQRGAVMGIILFTTLTYAFLLTWNVVSVAAHQPEYFYPASLLAATTWLDAHATYLDGVLASYTTSTMIPAHAGVRVHAGHHNETAWVDNRKAEIQKFFQADTSDTWRRDLLRRFSMTYVLYGPEERQLGDFDPAQTTYLKEVFSNGGIRIYRVEP